MNYFPTYTFSLCHEISYREYPAFGSDDKWVLQEYPTLVPIFAIFSGKRISERKQEGGK